MLTHPFLKNRLSVALTMPKLKLVYHLVSAVLSRPLIWHSWWWLQRLRECQRVPWMHSSLGIRDALFEQTICLHWHFVQVMGLCSVQVVCSTWSLLLLTLQGDSAENAFFMLTCFTVNKTGYVELMGSTVKSRVKWYTVTIVTWCDFYWNVTSILIPDCNRTITGTL